MFNLLKKYNTYLALWFWVFHYCGLKNVLINFSIWYLPTIKQETNFFIWFMAFIGSETGLCLSVGFTLHYYRKCDALIVLTSLAAANCLISMMKLYWHESRPYFLSDTVTPHKCSNVEYGLPSGHTMGSMAVFRTFARVVEERNTLPLVQGFAIISVCFVSYNRAVQ